MGKTNVAERIGILTGGGDCPGLNAVIRAATKRAYQLGWEVIGIKHGFEGLLKKRACMRIDPGDIRGILHLGGSILGANNRGNPFQFRVKVGKKWAVRDCSSEAMKRFTALQLKGLIAVGGDGTLSIAKRLFELGMPVVGVPKTIDNDVGGTVVTFGFDTAVSIATDALDKLHPTAESHNRVMVTEVMGRYAGWIALHAGIAGGADIILIPEIPFDLNVVCQKVRARYRRRRNFCIVVVAEGAIPKEGERVFKRQRDGAGKGVLGGIGDRVAREIEERTGHETRSLVLGHLQRGGSPTTFDRLLGTRFGVEAVNLICHKKFGSMVALAPPKIKSVSLKSAVSRLKRVSPSSDVVATAAALGISFGSTDF